MLKFRTDLYTHDVDLFGLGVVHCMDKVNALQSLSAIFNTYPYFEAPLLQ